MENKRQQLQDILYGALIGLARAVDCNDDVAQTAADVILEALTLSENASNEEIMAEIRKVHDKKYEIVPDCAVCQSPCGRTNDYKMKDLESSDPKIRTIKYDMLKALQTLSGIVSLKKMEPKMNFEMNAFLCEALFQIGYLESFEDLTAEMRKIEQRIDCCQQ